MKTVASHLNLRSLFAATAAAAITSTFAFAAPASEPTFAGGILTGANGMTLYTFDKDTPGSGKSVCNADCTPMWPPFLAGAADKPSGDLTVITRDDGKKQWAYKGHPLYYWAKDAKKGDRTGDNFLNVWHVIPNAAGLPAFADGFLVGPNGMTVYTFDKDTAGSGKSVCNADCTPMWPPLFVADGEKASGDFTIVTRDDGKKQWAHKGRPLYYWIKDAKKGDRTGDTFLNVWHVVKADAKR